MLAIGPITRGGRVPFATDPIQLAIVEGRWTAPQEGEGVAVGDRTLTWRKATAENGTFKGEGFSGGYAYAAYESVADSYAVLRAPGSNLVYVNGVPRAGDPYGYGYLRLPIELKKGRNDLLFVTGRGELQVEIETFAQPVELSLEDATVPDAIAGEDQPLWASLTVHNVMPAKLDKVVIRCEAEGHNAIETPQPSIMPLTRFKTRFAMPGKFDKPGEQKVEIELVMDGKVFDKKVVNLIVKEPYDLHRRTFISEIDGSVQYYAVLPAKPASPLSKPPALVLSLHGASVEATSQAGAYAQKSWVTFVCPTNRRPYGLDWEDWGRQDAMEALADAQKRYPHDPQAVYLTGHSMGGHGAWHLGVTFPDRFAAVGPSAGWASFFSYAGGQWNPDPGEVEAMFQRAQMPSRTLDLIENLDGLGVYILHGDADDNVPVSEARAMAKALEAFHKDYQLHEEAGAGHWWDKDNEPGASCVDWAPMFDLFSRRRIPLTKEVRRVRFATANVAVSGSRHWLRIHHAIHWGKISKVDFEVEPQSRTFNGKTENVAALSFVIRDVTAPGGPVTIVIDDQTITTSAAAENTVWLEKQGDTWRLVNGVAGKGHLRAGPFKHAFDRRAILVYGTSGTEEENAWSYATARLHAETWGYRANGSFEVMADRDVDLAATQGRSLILYGHAESNLLWPVLLKDHPAECKRGIIRFQGKTWTDDNLAYAFVAPRPGLGHALIGCIGGSGPKGMRLVSRAPFFVSGIAFPDLAIWRPSVLEKGYAGVEVAGFFGSDWSVDRGDWAFKP
jgi:predicted esterase